MSKALESGYTVIKNAPDDYDLVETYSIKDFTKPLKINREVPALSNFECYNNVPIGLLCHYWGFPFDYTIWCYLANKKDEEYIHFNDLRHIYKNDVDIANSFDWLRYIGHLNETDTHLEFYIYPQQSLYCQAPKAYIDEDRKRHTPVKCLD